MIVSVLLVFCLIFSFKIPFLYNSSFLALWIGFLFFNSRVLVDFKCIIKNKQVLLLQVIFLLPFLYALTSTILHGAYDFSFVRLYFSNVIYIIITMFIAAIVYDRNKGMMLDVLLATFSVQAIIISIAFISPDFRYFISLFQDASQNEKAIQYYGGGVRGLALSGGQFFNLSAVFSLAILTRILRVSMSGSKFKDILKLIFVTLASLTTGRTVIVGFIVGSLIYFSRVKLIFTVWKKFVAIQILSIFVLGILLYSGIIDNLIPVFYSYSRFAFEFIYNFVESGKVTTESTEVLSGMYFMPELGTIIFGDGKYTNSDGSYYMETDSGFMRNILLFGVFGLLLFVFYTLYQVWIYTKFYFYKNRYISFFLASLLFFLLHYKGEAFAYLITLNIFVSFLFFSVILEKR